MLTKVGNSLASCVSHHSSFHVRVNILSTLKKHHKDSFMEDNEDKECTGMLL